MTFDVFCGFFSHLKLKGELVLLYGGRTVGNSYFYYHYYLVLAGNNESVRVTPSTFSK